MDLSGQLRLSFGEKALDALDRAAAMSTRDRPVDTLDVFLSLMEVDAAADWQRIWLEFGELTVSAAGRHRDPLPYLGDWWNGRPVTGTCARAIRAAVALTGGSDPRLPVPAGVLALCLVGTPSTAASRALGATFEPAHSVLLELVQETLVKSHWNDMKSVLENCFDPRPPGAPGETHDEDPDVRRFLDYHADKIQALVDALNQFLQADTPDRAGALLEQYPELLSAPFDAIIVKSIEGAEQAGHHREARRFRERRRYLESYRQLIDKPQREMAGAEWLAGRGHHNEAPTGPTVSEPDPAPQPSRLSQRSEMSPLEVRLRQLGASPDPELVLDPAAQAEAAELLASAAELRTDARLLAMAGALHFLRWTADQDDQDELMAAMALFAPLLDGHKDLLPKPVRKFLARERTRQPRPGSPPASTALHAFLTDNRAASHAWGELLWQLSLVLYARYERVRQTPALSEAIAILRHAIAVTPPHDPDYSRRAASLGTWLLVMHARTGQPADLDTALTMLHPAVASMPDDGNRRPAVFSALGSALGSLFSLDNDLDALEGAIRAHRDGLRDLPADDLLYGHLLLRLAAALLRHYGRTLRLTSLDEAMEKLELAQAFATRNTERDPAVLAALSNNLSVALTARYERTKDESDLDEAIAAGQRAVRAACGTADRACAHGTLGIALLARYVRYASPGPADFLAEPTRVSAVLDDYLEEALDHLRTAAALSPADGPERASALTNLGIGLLRARAVGAPPEVVAEAGNVFGAAADGESAVPSVRIRASLTAGRLAADRRDWHAAVDRLAAAIELLEVAVPRGLRREDREHQLTRLRDLGSDAAACAWRDGDTERAVALFERGRGVLLAQEMDAPTQLGRLRAYNELLAEDFTALRLEVECAGRGDLVSDAGDWSGPTAAERRRVLLRRWDDLLSQIRVVPGFEEFPAPPHRASLLASGNEGPVALINVSGYGSAAFLIRDGGVTGIGLPDLTPAAVRAMVTELLTATDPRDTRDPLDPMASQRRLEYLLGWLWDAVAGPVLDHLGISARLDPEARAAGPRIWWCPSGLLSFLPLHAAGHHATRSDASPQTVMDRVISSYIPTIRMLDHARQAPAQTPGSTLIVAPGNAGTGGLMTEPTATGKRTGVTVLADAAATPGAVLSALPGHDRIYFACHAASDLNDPSMGYLELHDQQRLTVTDVAALHLGDAEFAFLGACSTYQGGTTLADEAIHLGGAFHLAGYRHVIATLWPIKDSATAARITRAVHQGVAGPAGVTAAAASLHRATRQQRDRVPGAPSLWAPYMHSGG